MTGDVRRCTGVQPLAVMLRDKGTVKSGGTLWVPPDACNRRATGYAVVQVKLELGTAPFDVGELNVQFTVRTRVSNEPFASWSWLSLIVAEVNAMSTMDSVHCGLGQPGAPGIGVTGAPVVVVIVTFPFLISLAGTAVPPETVVGAGF
jgi:hypothetical protein